MTFTRQELATILEFLDEAEDRLTEREAREPMLSEAVLTGSDGSLLGSVVLDLRVPTAGSYRFKAAA